MGVGTSAAVIPAAIGAGGSIGGALINSGAAGAQNQLLQQQSLTEQDQRNLMDTYAQLQQQYGNDAANFYLKYMAQGNPFLSNLLSQHFGQIAQQYGNQQGQLSQNLAASGFGAAPSGLAAATMGNLSNQEANTQSESWLNDMMQNEQLKFNAAQGLGGIANMFQPGQFALHRFSNATPAQSPWTQVPGAIGNVLGTAFGNTGTFGGGSVGGVSDPGLGSPSYMPSTPGSQSPVPTPPSPWNIPGIPGLPNLNPNG